MTWHKQQTVKTRVFALKESFFPTSDVSYAATVQRMATLLGLVDDQTVLAYLGRPEYIKEQKIDQTVRYIKSGTVVNKRHYFRHRLKAKKGYIERFEAGYVYVKDGEWWVHWNHEVQLTLPESEGLEQRASKEGFSLHKIRDEDIEIEPTETRTEINETEKRECI